MYFFIAILCTFLLQNTLLFPLVIKIISNDLESNYSMCTTNYIKEFRDDEIEV